MHGVQSGTDSVLELAAPQECAGSTKVEVRPLERGVLLLSLGACSERSSVLPCAALPWHTGAVPSSPTVTALVSVDPKGSRGLAVPGGLRQTSAIAWDMFPLPFLAWVEGGQHGLAGRCLAQQAPAGHFQVLLLLPAKYKPQ